MIEWRFKPNSRDDMDVDPIQGEFFTTRDIDNISTAVIREGIQNALDERNRTGGSETVKARIALSGNKYAIKPEEYINLLEKLIPHLESKTSGIQKLPSFKDSMKYLVFEDFNTKGLEGDPTEYYVENITDGNPHNFYYFWRNVGRSGKSDDKLGRWGLGKTVFPASSQINTFWGVTVRKNDNKKLLLGQSILRIHNLEGTEKEECGYRPYGMYGDYNTEKEYFANPIALEDQLNIFENLFRLKRGNNSGLSLIIPFVSEEITIYHLAYASIEQYFYPILSGKLEIEIIHEDEEIILNKSSLYEGIEKIRFDIISNASDKKKRSKENLRKLFDFAKWTFQLSDEDYFWLTPIELINQPRWVRTLFSNEDALNKLRDKFEEGERIAFKVPLKYQPTNSEPKLCWYSAFLEKDISLVKPENLFVRDGITISGITSLEKGNARGMVIIQDIDLARMLGDSENPAHTEWQADSRNFKGKYVHGKECLSFVKSTLRQIYERLQKPIEGIQKDLLIDFFSLPIETIEDKKEKKLPKPDDGTNEINEDEVPLIEVKKQPYKIEKIKSGLKVYKNPEATEIPEQLKLRIGYDVPRGNPITSYQELDFDVSKKPIQIESSGIYFLTKEKNVIEFEIINKDYFELILTGFDEKRDLYIKLH
jgi:hypothetical protein